MPHRICLRGPWEFDPLKNCYTRRFHQPTGLTATTYVWLLIDDLSAAARIELNGTLTGEVVAGQAARLNITANLKPHNRLAITLAAKQSASEKPSDGPIGPVSLEIEEPSA